MYISKKKFVANSSNIGQVMTLVLGATHRCVAHNSALGLILNSSCVDIQTEHLFLLLMVFYRNCSCNTFCADMLEGLDTETRQVVQYSEHVSELNFKYPHMKARWVSFCCKPQKAASLIYPIQGAERSAAYTGLSCLLCVLAASNWWICQTGKFQTISCWHEKWQMQRHEKWQSKKPTYFLTPKQLINYWMKWPCFPDCWFQKAR